MIQTGQLRSGEQDGIEQRGDQTAPAKNVSVNEYDPHRERLFLVGVPYFAQIVTVGELAQN
jgi:hypothetical protein